jgi:small subunit ribosomal protein S2
MNGLRQGLMELGAHIGTSKSKVNPYMNSYLVGHRRGTAIIDLNQTITQLRRAQAFLRDIGRRGGHVLFYHGTMYQYPSMIQATAMSIFRNRNLSYLDKQWPKGMLTNYNAIFTEIFRALGTSAGTQTIGLRWMFVKVVLHVLDSKQGDWDSHMHEMKKYWRLLSLFKLYKFCNKLPDVLVYINPNRDYIPVREANLLGIPVVGTVDTDHFYHKLTYPIVTNDDSILLSLFYFELLAKAYEEGQREMLTI